MSKTKNMETLKEELSALAERIARKGFNIELNYSIDSVRQVEQILAEIHKEYNRTKNDDGIRGIALEFAAYIVKVIEQHFHKGIWKRDHPEFGRETFPYSWCLKRIVDGSQDDVWSKFQSLVISKVSDTA